MTLLPDVSRRTALTGAGVSALALVLAACGANEKSSSASASGTAVASATKGGTLYVLSADSDINWDPAKSQSLAVTSLALMHRRLTTWKLEPGKDPEVVPDLATDTGSVSDDGLTWTYTLKDGLTLSDGTPITAAHLRELLRQLDALQSDELCACNWKAGAATIDALHEMEV